ncbi:MAG TPA: DUF1552 domain-containing protein [Polyangia bacterium]|jgi:hypothetical protein|nr:DUF1552 domain-containing protein [Polyangia bacterium]
MVGLPALDVLTARKAGAQAAAAPQRLMCIGAGSGFRMDEFTPKTPGPNYDLPRILQSFAPIRNKVSVFSGLGIDEGAKSPGDHGAGVAVTFTCVSPKPQFSNTNSQTYTGNGTGFSLGISFDQVMARQLGGLTRIPSLQLGLREGLPLGDGPFGPVYLKNLSWASATEPLTPTVNPGVVFDQIFTGLDPAATAAERARRLSRSMSVLDYVAQERALLYPALSGADRARIDQYFTSAREIERRLAAARTEGGGGGIAGPGCSPGAKPGIDLSYPDTFKAMADLSILAMQCDVTRIIMLQMSCYRNDAHYSFLNVSNNHHNLSHAGGEAAPNSDYRIVNRWIGDQLGYLFNTMDAVKEPTGTLLDNSIGVFNNDCGDGNSHDHRFLPVLVAGGARGKFPTGRHYVFPRNTPCCGLYVTLLNAMGVTVQTFGAKNSGPLSLPA